MKRKLYLSLGSNLGNRRMNLETAERQLEETFGEIVAESQILETQAVGFDGPPFLNQILIFKSSFSPEQVLSRCKEIERAMGRTDSPEWDENGQRIYHNRLIDIDILKYGNLRINTPDLQIPHPQINERLFIKTLLEGIDG